MPKKKQDAAFRELDKDAYLKLLQTPGMTDKEFRKALKDLPSAKKGDGDEKR